MLKNVTPRMAWDHLIQIFKIMPMMMMMKKKYGFNDFQYIQLLQHTQVYTALTTQTLVLEKYRA